jgi:DNA (cytosine-5)-methyltransferase 1
MRGLAPNEIIVDLFCGGGGATQGIEQAGYVVSECVDHCPTAIATHQANHPATNHRRGDVWENPPEMVAAGRPVGLLWASPDCRHFSRARGAAPVSRRVRDLAWVVTEWATSLPPAAPRVILVENVPEFVTWGPLRRKRDANNKPMSDAQGRALMEPVPERRGVTFKRWVRTLERAGYKVEWKVLDAADFGAASRRKRLFVMARRDGQPIVWPEVTHGCSQSDGRWASGDQRSGVGEATARLGRGRRSNRDRSARQIGTSDWTRREHDKGQGHGQQRCNSSGSRDAASAGQARQNRGLGVQVPRHSRRRAADIIDWSDLGTSIFERERPLKDKTLARIAEGVRRYVLNDPAPFLLRVTQTGGGAGGGWHVSHSPAPTITTGGHAALVAALMLKFYGNETGGQSAKLPLGTVTTLDRHAVVCVVLDGQQYVIVDILFRMLKPKELAAAMAFPAHYVWPRTQREAVRLIGNAVSPVMSEALTLAAIGEGPRREAGRKGEAA